MSDGVQPRLAVRTAEYISSMHVRRCPRRCASAKQDKGFDIIQLPSWQPNSVRQHGKLDVAGFAAQNSSSAANDKHYFIMLLPLKFTVGFVE